MGGLLNSYVCENIHSNELISYLPKPCVIACNRKFNASAIISSEHRDYPKTLPEPSAKIHLFKGLKKEAIWALQKLSFELIWSKTHSSLSISNPCRNSDVSHFNQLNFPILYI